MKSTILGSPSRQIGFCVHSYHEISFGFHYSSDQVIVQYSFRFTGWHKMTVKKLIRLKKGSHYIKKIRFLQWKRCFERVSLGIIYSATNTLFSFCVTTDQSNLLFQQSNLPNKLSNLWFPTSRHQLLPTDFTSQPRSTQEQYSQVYKS